LNTIRSAMDRDARKQVLLTRIAFERIELRRDLALVEQSVHVPRILRAVLGGGLGSVFAKASLDKNAGNWAALALSMLRRYRVAATLLGGLVPMVTGRSGWRRVVRLGAVAAAAWFGWRAMRGRGDSPPS
jgi:hypothetical protein